MEFVPELPATTQTQLRERCDNKEDMSLQDLDVSRGVISVIVRGKRKYTVHCYGFEEITQAFEKAEPSFLWDNGKYNTKHRIYKMPYLEIWIDSGSYLLLRAFNTLVVQENKPVKRARDYTVMLYNLIPVKRALLLQEREVEDEDLDPGTFQPYIEDVNPLFFNTYPPVKLQFSDEEWYMGDVNRELKPHGKGMLMQQNQFVLGVFEKGRYIGNLFFTNRNDEGQNILFDNHSYDTLDLLLRSGGNPNEVDLYGNTPLFFEKSLHNVKLLIDRGANINIINNAGQSPLHTQQSPEVVKYLIDAGLNVNLRDNHGRTPLRTQSNVDVVKVLLTHEANPMIKDTTNVRPIDNPVIRRGLCDYDNNEEEDELSE